MKVVVGHWSSSVVRWWRKSRRVDPSRRIRQTPVVTRRRGTRSQNCSHHQCTSPQVSAPARSKRHDRSDENVVDHHQLRNRRNPSRRQTLLGWRGSLDRARLTNTVASTAVYTERVDFEEYTSTQVRLSAPKAISEVHDRTERGFHPRL